MLVLFVAQTLANTHPGSCVDFSPAIVLREAKENRVSDLFAGATTAGNGDVIFAPYGSVCVGVFNAAEKTLSCVDLNHPICPDRDTLGRFSRKCSRKFSGATMGNNDVAIFAPEREDCVGIYNPESRQFECVDIASQDPEGFDKFLDTEHKFSDAVTTSGGLIVFAPLGADCVGVFNATSKEFRCVDISSAVISNGEFLFDDDDNPSSNRKFRGAAMSQDGRVIFAPFNADCVGVFDPATDTFSCIDISPSAIGSCTQSAEEWQGWECDDPGKLGCTALQGWTPPNEGRMSCEFLSTDETTCSKMPNVGPIGGCWGELYCHYPAAEFLAGIGQTHTGATSDRMRDLCPGHCAGECSGGGGIVDEQFHGATLADNGRIIFAPYDAGCIGVFDPATDVFSCVDMGSEAPKEWVQGKYYTREELDVQEADREAGRWPRRAMRAKFAGATTASNGLVVFTPAEANCTGVFNPATNAFRCVSVNASRWGTGDREKFRGATTAGDGLVVFAPHEVREQEPCVGIFDPALVSWDSSAKVNIDIDAASAVVLAGLGISTAALLWTCVSRRSQKSL